MQHGTMQSCAAFSLLFLPKYGTIPTPNISEWRTRGDYFLTTFHVHDIPKYSVILYDCVIILMSRDRVNTFVIHRWCAFQRITRNIKEQEYMIKILFVCHGSVILHTKQLRIARNSAELRGFCEIRDYHKTTFARMKGNECKWRYFRHLMEKMKGWNCRHCLQF